MSELPLVIHLVDDTTAGGVTRVLDYIATSPALTRLADHRFETVARGRVSLRRYKADVIVSHLAISWRNLPALLAIRAANPGARLVHVEHSYTKGFMQHNVPNTRRFLRLLKTGFAIFDAVVAVSQAQARWFRKEELCADAKLFAIRSCVDLSAFTQLAPAGNSGKIIGAIGRMDRQKGFDTLIEGFRAVEDDTLALHFYGAGAEFETLQALAEGDARIVFKGFTADPVEAYAAVDVVVLPSRWEAYGLVAIEALCAGRTVLCAPVDGLTDHADYGARFLASRSADAIADGLRALDPAHTPSIQGVQTHVAARAEAEFAHGWARLLDAMLQKPVSQPVAVSARLQ
ncbi:glycosyltransferase family 4 protein [Cognatishimia sp. F0-27]|uniref:glycosyltransferase family 4 protein n=1 Tax=Cognatishimia sp. F0-27 TaxID=2816855 RepID=UPI001D0CC703|nr:glycosyltransferase family 4 protein [Cognatishimia sp. F0-27]MCC1493860.1 glycosyltransferase family 4 protein [Cognatishimia sp. F0-27]